MNENIVDIDVAKAIPPCDKYFIKITDNVKLVINCKIEMYKIFFISPVAIKTDWKHLIIMTNGNPKEYIVNASATDLLDSWSKLPLSNKLLIINSGKKNRVNIDGIAKYNEILIAIIKWSEIFLLFLTTLGWEIDDNKTVPKETPIIPKGNWMILSE